MFAISTPSGILVALYCIGLEWLVAAGGGFKAAGVIVNRLLARRSLTLPYGVPARAGTQIALQNGSRQRLQATTQIEKAGLSSGELAIERTLDGSQGTVFAPE